MEKVRKREMNDFQSSSVEMKRENKKRTYCNSIQKVDLNK